GVIHRDLKPGNVMIEAQGIPLITDFGLARATDTDQNFATVSGTHVGTPAYMSPEQVNGDTEAIGPATDVYALGVIMYELLTGQPPFTGKGLAVLGQITSGKPPIPPSEIAEVGKSLDSVCLKAMAFEQSDRYQTADDLAAALDQLPPDAMLPRPESKGPLRMLAAVAVLVPALFFLLQSITVRTSTGELVIAAAEGTDVRVEVRSGSEVVGILGPDNGWKLRVDSGEYKVLMLSSDYQLDLNGDTVIVSKDGVAEVTIQSRPLPPPEPEFSGDYALAFSGNSSYVHAPGVNRSGDAPITLEAWVCPTAYGTDPTVIARVYGPAVLQLARSGNNFWGWDGKSPLPYVDAIHPPHFAPRYEMGKWYHVAIVADEESTTLYVSGLLCWKLPRNQAPDPGDGEGLCIAAHPWAGAVRYFFTGLVDELRVSAVCRYSGNFEPVRRFEPDEHTVALYHFDAGSGSKLFDASGNEHHGTVVGASWQKLEEPITTAPTGPSTQSFRETSVGTSASFVTRGILRDFDGDGDLDAFLTNYDAPDSVLWNDGDGGFTDSGQQIGNSKSVGIAFGDLDGDGDLDAFVPNVGGQPNSVYINEGAGIFTDSGQALGKSGSKAAVLIDFDRDGDLDAFVANYDWGVENRVYLNDGSGNFSESGHTYGDSPSYGLVLADFDDDGDPDIFVANGKGHPNRIYLNRGAGELLDGGQRLGESYSLGAAAGDVDGDGDLDLVVANRAINKVWLNDGAGVFSDSSMDFEPQDSWGVSLGDIDGDGDLDVFVSNHGYNSVWFNDGSGRFVNPEYYHDEKTHYAELQDVDSDDDLDVFLVNENGPVRLLLNKRF
ncbi:MAG: VCBS repeat-containing protein, partial [Planctomycetaceae bacterium]|nr:VCBS repeat-containing protein [Planctomycetaceae bacterium]